MISLEWRWRIPLATPGCIPVGVGGVFQVLVDLAAYSHCSSAILTPHDPVVASRTHFRSQVPCRASLTSPPVRLLVGAASSLYSRRFHFIVRFLHS